MSGKSDNGAPAHDFLLPRLNDLVNQAQAAGFVREVVVAVLIDLVTSPTFDTAAPDPLTDSEPRNLWNRTKESLVLIGGTVPREPPALDATDEADFIKPIGPLTPS